MFTSTPCITADTGVERFDPRAGEEDGTHVALEATYGWEWLAELLEDAGFDVHLAHPLRTRAIAAARVKTDAVDARTLAHLQRTGLLPEAYIAPPQLRDLRELLRHRATLVHLRTSIKNRVHALLARQGKGGIWRARFETRDWSEAGLRWLPAGFRRACGEARVRQCRASRPRWMRLGVVNACRCYAP
jgi:transposase